MSAIDEGTSSGVGSISYLQFCWCVREVGSAGSERYDQTPVDDPDLLDVRLDERWQEAIQRDDEGGRFLEGDELLRELLPEEPEKQHGQRKAGSGRVLQRHANGRSPGEQLADLDGKGDGDELTDRALDPQQAVEEPEADPLDRRDAHGRHEGVQPPAVDPDFDLIPLDEMSHEFSVSLPVLGTPHGALYYAAPMPKRTDIKSILIIGSGPIIIGQACEFDYSGTQACKALKEEGYRIILVNSNPATIMTDAEFADRTYIEPLTPESIERIIERERPDAILPTVGGQTGINMATALWERGTLQRFGVELIGANYEAIKTAEDRQLFTNGRSGIGVAG